MRGQFMIDLAFINGPDVAHAGEEALGAWLRIQAYAAQQGRGGCILACRAWDNRRWMVTARTELPAIDKAVAAGLLEWDGQDLLIEGYDDRGEELYKAKSEGGKKGKQRQQENQRSRESHGESHRVDAGTPTAPSLAFPVQALPSLSKPSQAEPVQADSPSSPPSPAGEDSPATTATARARSALGKKLENISKAEVIQAVADESLMGLVKAFKANCFRGAEWENATQGSKIAAVLVTFHYALTTLRNAIREPSGYRSAYEIVFALPRSQRDGVVRDCYRHYGLEDPDKAVSDCEQPPQGTDDVRLASRKPTLSPDQIAYMDELLGVKREKTDA